MSDKPTDKILSEIQEAIPSELFKETLEKHFAKRFSKQIWKETIEGASLWGKNLSDNRVEEILKELGLD